MDIYVQKGGQKHGPFSEDQIRRGIDAGEFSANDPAWTQGKASWQPLSALIRLDMTQPPPILASVAMTNMARLRESSPATPPIVERIEPIPVVEGHWKRQYKCKRCNAPFRTFTLGRWKVTDNCGECNDRHNRAITVSIAVCLIAVFVADKILDREHEDQIKKANAYVSSLRKPASHATPDDNALLFPPSTPRPIVSSSGLQIEPLRRRAGSMAFPTIPPLAESPTSTQSFSANEQHVGLRKNEAAFLAIYGKSRGSYPAPPSEPLGGKVDWFYVAELYYMILFQHDIAQDVLVMRKDGQELTEENIRIALNGYADGETWRSAPSTDASVIKRWERDGAVANLGKHHDNGGSRGANNPDQFLQIATTEYIHGFDRGR